MHCPCKLPLPCCRRRCPPLTRLRPPPGSSWPSRWSPKSLASCYQLTLLKRLSCTRFKTLLHSSYYFETNKIKRTHDQMNSIGPPYIWYTHNTTHRKKLLLPTKHLEQTAIAAPIDKLISSNPLWSRFLIAASKRLSIPWNFINSLFAEEIWSQLDKPPWFKHFPFIWRPVVCPL